MTSNKKRILIAGGTGFLGIHLCEQLLKQNNKVICLSRSITNREKDIAKLSQNRNFEFIKHDIILPLSLKVDEIYNMIGPSAPARYQQNPVDTIKASIIGSINLLELAREHNAKIFLPSTCKIYGEPEVNPVPENYWGHVDPIGKHACYEESKRCTETLFFDYHRQYNVKIKIARLFNSYGPKLSLADGAVIPTLIIQALQGKNISIFGSGNQTRSFCYVDDLLQGIMLLMNSDDDFIGPVNIGNPEEITVKDLATKIIALTNSNSKMLFQDAQFENFKKMQPDITLANQKLNWEPKIDLNEGLKRTIEYFKKLATDLRR